MSKHADTVVVLTINYADWGSDGVIILTRSAPYEKSKSLGSGGSMVARLKLKDIDGRAPPGVKSTTATLRLEQCRPRSAVGPIGGLKPWYFCRNCEVSVILRKPHAQIAGKYRDDRAPPSGRKAPGMVTAPGIANRYHPQAPA